MDNIKAIKKLFSDYQEKQKILEMKSDLYFIPFLLPKKDITKTRIEKGIKVFHQLIHFIVTASSMFEIYSKYFYRTDMGNHIKKIAKKFKEFVKKSKSSENYDMLQDNCIPFSEVIEIFTIRLKKFKAGKDTQQLEEFYEFYYRFYDELEKVLKKFEKQHENIIHDKEINYDYYKPSKNIDMRYQGQD